MESLFNTGCFKYLRKERCLWAQSLNMWHIRRQFANVCTTKSKTTVCKCNAKLLQEDICAKWWQRLLLPMGPSHHLSSLVFSLSLIKLEEYYCLVEVSLTIHVHTFDCSSLTSYCVKTYLDPRSTVSWIIEMSYVDRPDSHTDNGDHLHVEHHNRHWLADYSMHYCENQMTKSYGESIQLVDIVLTEFNK